VKTAVGFTLPSAAVTPAPNRNRKRRCGTASLLELSFWERFVLSLWHPEASEWLAAEMGNVAIYVWKESLTQALEASALAVTLSPSPRPESSP